MIINHAATATFLAIATIEEAEKATLEAIAAKLEAILPSYLAPEYTSLV